MSEQETKQEIAERLLTLFAVHPSEPDKRERESRMRVLAARLAAMVAAE